MAEASTGNIFSVYLAQQENAGVPDPAPAFAQFRRTGGKGEKQTNFTQSSEVKQNRQARGQIKESITLESSLEFELSQFIINLLPNAFFSVPGFLQFADASAMTLTASTNKLIDTNFGFIGVGEGTWIFLEGAGEGNGDGAYYVESRVDDNELNITPGQIVSDVVAGTFSEVKFNTLRTGNDKQYLTVQTRVDKAAGGVDYLNDLTALVSSFNLTLPTSGIITGSIGLQASNRVDSRLSLSGQFDTLEDESEVLSAVDGISSIWINFIKQDVGFTEFSLDLENTVAGVPQAGREGFGCLTAGSLTAGGTLNSIAFESNPLAEYDKYSDGVIFSLSVPFKWEDGKEMIITMRRCKYTELSNPDGSDEAVVSSGTYSAEEDEYNTTVQIDMNF